MPVSFSFVEGGNSIGLYIWQPLSSFIGWTSKVVRFLSYFTSTAINMKAQVSQDLESSGCIRRRDIAGSHAVMLWCLRSLHTHSTLAAPVVFPLALGKDSILFTSLPVFATIFFLRENIFTGVGGTSELFPFVFPWWLRGWAVFPNFVSHLHLFFGEMSIQFISLLIDWVIQVVL